MIPVNEPLFLGNEKQYLNECIDTGWVSSEGPFVKKFEQSFASYLGLSHGVSVCNGTAAVETALYAVGVGPGDEVIMPSFTIISCVAACLRLGAKPVLVDIEPVTWNMDVRQIESKVTKNTKAIMAVHIYGHPVDMDPVFEVAEKHNLKIVEDAAEVHGAEYYSQKKDAWLKCGSMGDVAAFSFYANKIINTGEGGMVVTRDDTVAKRAQSYRNLCFRADKRFLHDELGYNFRMTNLQAAVGLAQVEKIDSYIEIKRKWADVYRAKFSKIEGVKFQPVKDYARSVYWMYCIELDPKLGVEAEDLMNRLRKYKIGTRPFFRGMHDQPVLNEMGLFVGESYPMTDHAYKYGLYVPSGMALTEKQVDVVCDAVAEELK